MEKEIKTQIKELFKKLGIAPNIRGYHYLLEAILFVYEKKIKYLFKSTDLYKDIAKKYNDTYTSVERAMRTAIESGYLKGDLNLYDKLFGYTISKIKGKPTNTEFIFTLVEELETVNG